MEERCWQRLAGGDSGRRALGQEPARGCRHHRPLLARQPEQIREAWWGEPDKGSASLSLAGSRLWNGSWREMRQGLGWEELFHPLAPTSGGKGMGGENAGQAAGVSPRARPHPDSLGWAGLDEAIPRDCSCRAPSWDQTLLSW